MPIDDTVLSGPGPHMSLGELGNYTTPMDHDLIILCFLVMGTCDTPYAQGCSTIISFINSAKWQKVSAARDGRLLVLDA